MSGDPEQNYFADGMVEDIITLSRIRWLFVIARASSLTYKGQAIDVTAREVRALPQTSGTYSRPNFALFRAQAIDIIRSGWCRSVYAVGVRPRRSKARCCVRVGVARMAVRRSRPRRTALRGSVARSPSRVWKLCTGSGSPSGG